MKSGGRASIRSAELRSDETGDLARLREAPGLFLRKDHFFVEGDFEHAAAPFDQLGSEAVSAFDFVRQTGGSWQVASGSAVFDDETMIHPNSPFARSI